MPVQHRHRLHLLLSPLVLCAVSGFAAEAKPRVLTRVAPTYPELARRMHVTGTVILHVTVNPDGKVASTRVESGHALLVPAAEDAVRRWRFAPSAEPSESSIDIDFTDSPR